MTALLKPLLRRIDFGTPLKDTASLSLDFARQQYYAEGLGDTFGEIVTFTRSTTGTYFDSAGVLQTAATNAPRFDHDPVTLQPRGLLIEEARTNLLLQSADFSNATWLKSAGISFAVDETLAPDGTPMQLATLTGTANHQVVQVLSAPLTVGQTYTLSVHMLAKSRDFGVQIAYYDGGTSLNSAIPTVKTGRTGRYTFTFTPTVTATSPQIRLVGYSNGIDGDQVYIWGAQLESGAFPTSYIPTVASQVTRAADVASVNTLSPWYNATEGTLFVGGSSFGLGSSSASWAVAFTDGTTNNYIAMRRNASGIGAGVVVGGAAQASFAAAYTNAANTRLALSSALNDFRFSKDGASVLSDTAGTVPAVNNLLIGAAVAASYWNGHIRALRYFPRKLSNSELQAITV